MATLILPVFLNSTAAGATVTEPQLTISGTVTKDIIDMNNIWLYTDQNGKNQTLGYTRDDNITFDYGNIHFKQPFENASVQGQKSYSEASGISLSAQYLVDANLIPYILLEAHNTSNLAYSYFFALLEDSVDRIFDPNAYLVFAVKVLQSDTGTYAISARLRLIDEGGEDHILVVLILNQTGTDFIQIYDEYWNGAKDGKSDDIQVFLYNRNPISNYLVVQFKLADLFAKAGIPTNIVKIAGIGYGVKSSGLTTGDNTIKAAFRMLFIQDSPLKVNNQIVNGTSTSVNSNTISINRDVVKIADATIPFQTEITPDKSFDSSTLTATYNYMFSLPSDPALSFSNVIANFTVGDFVSPKANLTYFLVSGADYTEQLATQGYYTWSITPGTQYVVNAKFALTKELFDAVVGTESGPPSFWVDPLGWISYQFWNLVAFAASVLGLTGVVAYAKQQKRQIKAKTASKR